MSAAVRVLSSLPAEAPGFDVRDAEALARLHLAELRHFWHRARRRFIVQELRALSVLPPARVLELGCGAGSVSLALAQEGYRVVGADGHRGLLELAHRRAPQAEYWQVDLADERLAWPARDFDAVGLFDVIEHLERPRPLLERALRALRPGGVLVGTVPAARTLWSPVDVSAGHQRRYEREELRAELTTLEGARLLEVAPFFRVLYPLMWWQRRRLRRRTPAAASRANLALPRWPINGALEALLELERRAVAGIPRVLPGASLWFAVRRRD